MQEPEAVTLEDDDVLAHTGEEADAPADTGAGVAPEDVDPPAESPAPEESPADAPAEAPAPGGAWRVAKALLQLRAEIDARWPNRDRRTDGTIGDTRHCGPGRTSDHCPNANGVVRALDVDSDGIPAGWLAEHIRKRGAAGDPRLADGGYVIFNRRIASWKRGWKWNDYTGDSPHLDHLHISVSQNASGYDGGGGWGVRAAVVTGGGTSTPADLPKHPLGSRVLKRAQPTMRGTDVAFVQRWVGAHDDGAFGEKTEARVQRFQRIVDLEPTGVVGPETWREMRVG
jgi:peptidoglycan hydrolase-like protein with peptidoglycan-binding domain